MADINFGEPAEVKVPVVDTENKDTLNSNPLSDVNTNASEIDDKGMSVEELNDPNKIKVTIADRDTPVIVLFGPPACGKTMTLIRLSRFCKRRAILFAQMSLFVQALIDIIRKCAIILTR